jgi:hypothetical protein
MASDATTAVDGQRFRPPYLDQTMQAETFWLGIPAVRGNKNHAFQELAWDKRLVTPTVESLGAQVIGNAFNFNGCSADVPRQAHCPMHVGAHAAPVLPLHEHFALR